MNDNSEITDLIQLKYEPENLSASPADSLRLDQFLASNLKQFSRAQLQRLIGAGQILVNGKAEKAGYRLRPGQEVTIVTMPPVPSTLEPEAVPLDILFEDEYLAVVNKPAGVVVHPGAGVHSGTLVHALLHHMQGSLSGIGGIMRPGIVHRLDKDTSGLLVIAKADRVHQHLAKQIQNKEAKRIYLAIVEGSLPKQCASINAPIGRHPGRRTEMAIVKTGRSAQTVYTVLAGTRVNQTVFSLVKLELKTGRTHQIRVHMASLNCPVIGDLVYNRKSMGTIAARKRLHLLGQALHAYQLSFVHPITDQHLEFKSSLPPDWADIMVKLFPYINLSDLLL